MDAQPVPEVRISPRSIRVLIAVVVVLALLGALSVVLNRRHDQVRRQVTISGHGLKTAVLQIDSGADRIRVTTADLGGDLAQVSTPDAAAVHPVADLSGHHLRVHAADETNGYSDSRSLGGAPVEINVKIAKGVLWDVVVDQGSKQVLLSLGTGRVHSVELNAGADHAEVTLPAPNGIEVVHLTGGLSSASFHLPSGYAAQLRFGSGAGSATVDGTAHQGIPSGFNLLTTSTGTNPAGQFSLDLSAGVGSVLLDRYSPAS
jgi:hypothetical protein